MAPASAGDRPLAGVRVVVTRPREQAAAFVAGLEERGAEAIVAPTICVVGPEDPEPLRRAVRHVGDYDWIVFTSVNGVRFFWDELGRAGGDAGALEGVRFACVGPSTAEALAEHGVEAEVVPERYVAEAVVEAVVEAGRVTAGGASAGRPSAGRPSAAGEGKGRGAGGRPLEGVRILLPLAAGAREVLAEGLAERGAVVDRVEAYRSVPDSERAGELRRRLVEGDVDVITFTASSTVDSFVAAVGTDVGRAVVAAIGPITARTARRHGLPVEIVAEEYTIAGLLDALVHRFHGERGTPSGV